MHIVCSKVGVPRELIHASRGGFFDASTATVRRGPWTGVRIENQVVPSLLILLAVVVTCLQITRFVEENVPLIFARIIRRANAAVFELNVIIHHTIIDQSSKKPNPVEAAVVLAIFHISAVSDKMIRRQ